MKRIAAFLLGSATVISMAACTGTETETEPDDTGTTAAVEDVVEDPDTYEGAVLYTDIAEEFGPIPAPADGTQLGFVAKAFENEFWGALRDGVVAQGEDLAAAGVGVEIDVRAAQGESDEPGQAALMSDMVNRGYDAIMASPISDGNLVQATENAHEAGIPVVNVIGGFASQMDIFVGARSYESGQLAAQWLADQIGGDGGEVAVIMGLARESAARARTQGFEDWFEQNSTNVTVVATENGDWDRGTARDVMQTLLRTHPDLAGVYANNDTMVMGALEAIKAEDMLDDIYVIGNDGTNEALESIRLGELGATVNIYPDFAGRISVDIALRALGGQELPKVIYTNQAVIDSTNVDLSPAEVIGWQDLVFAD